MVALGAGSRGSKSSWLLFEYFDVAMDGEKLIHMEGGQLAKRSYSPSLVLGMYCIGNNGVILYCKFN